MFRWNAASSKWDKVSKRGTVEIYDGKDGEKWVVIKEGSERVKHIVPNRNSAAFKQNSERMSCQWMGRDDVVLKGEVTLTVYFNDRGVFDRFVTQFQSSMAANIK